MKLDQFPRHPLLSRMMGADSGLDPGGFASWAFEAHL